MKEQLIFVYNAKSDLFSTITDFAHKILSPSTYSCRLCTLAYGTFSAKQEWKSFLESLTVETVFLHKNEFQKHYKAEVLLPAVFVSTNENLSQIITKQEIDSCQSLAALKSLVTQKWKEHVQHHHTDLQ